MAKEKLNIDDIRTMMELMGGQRTQTAIPTVQVQQDSFQSFTGGVMKGWPFILAMGSVAFWVMQSIYGINSTLAQHETQISANTDAIKSMDTKLDAQAQSSNDIIRRLDSLQTAVDNLKAK